MTGEIEHFITYLAIERNCSEKTLASYGSDLGQFYSFIMEHEGRTDGPYDVAARIHDSDVVISSVRKEDITSFIEFLYDSGLKRISIERKLAAIKSFFRFCTNRNYIEKNPSLKISYPMKETRLPRFLYLNQINRILDFPRESFLDYRDRAVLTALYSTGTRVSELSGADLVDLDLQAGRLKVMGKGSSERMVFLTPDAVQSIREYLRERRVMFREPEGPLFVNRLGTRISVRGIFNIVDRRVKNAGLIDKATPHTFRHSFATEMLNRGADIRAVQEMLGHKNLSTTQVYTHTTKKRLRAIYDRFHPHSGRGEGE